MYLQAKRYDERPCYDEYEMGPPEATIVGFELRAEALRFVVEGLLHLLHLSGLFCFALPRHCCSRPATVVFKYVRYAQPVVCMETCRDV